MAYEPDELRDRKRLAQFVHIQKLLQGTGKELDKERKKEYKALLARKQADPICTIQVRESTVEKLRHSNICTKGIGNGQSYDDLLNNLLAMVEKGNRVT
jgi:hypothetical protein